MGREIVMNDKVKTSVLLCQAEREIATILQRLETETGSVVNAIEVVDIEVTNFSSTRDEWERRVLVELKRPPGTRWGQAE